MAEDNPKREPRMSDEQTAETVETPAGTSEDSATDGAVLPDDHPLVRALAAQKEQIKSLKAKAQRLDEIEDAQKSEAQRAAERIAELEAQANEAKRDALRFKVASKHGISDEDAELFLTASDEETLTKQAERLAAHREDAGKPRQPKPDRNQGRTEGGSTSTADQFAAAVGGLL